jgi:hypothetical protein
VTRSGSDKKWRCVGDKEGRAKKGGDEDAIVNNE